MSRRWAVRLARNDAKAAGRLRRWPGVMVCEHEGDIWLSGDRLDEALDLLLRSLPGAERFTVGGGNELVPADHRVPHGHLPEGEWQSLLDWITVDLPSARFGGELSRRVPLTLVRTSAVEEPSILLTVLPEWHDYAASAPQVRLGCWQFAVSDDKRVVVRGRPLPSLRGERFVEHGGVAIPAGWSWSPAIDAADVARLLGLEPHDLALLHVDGSWERIPSDQFVRAARSAVRLSIQESAS